MASLLSSLRFRFRGTRSQKIYLDKKKQKKEKKINKRKDKIHPVLKKMLAAKKRKSDKEQIIITFRDNLTIPRFPVLNPNESRTSRTKKIALKESENLVKR